MEKRGVIPKGLQKPLSMTNYRIYFTNENLCFNITVLILRGFFFTQWSILCFRSCKQLTKKFNAWSLKLSSTVHFVDRPRMLFELTHIIKKKLTKNIISQSSVPPRRLCSVVSLGCNEMELPVLQLPTMYFSFLIDPLVQLTFPPA